MSRSGRAITLFANYTDCSSFYDSLDLPCAQQGKHEVHCDLKVEGNLHSLCAMDALSFLFNYERKAYVYISHLPTNRAGMRPCSGWRRWRHTHHLWFEVESRYCIRRALYWIPIYFNSHLILTAFSSSLSIVPVRSLDHNYCKFGGLISTSNLLDSDVVTVETDQPVIWTVELR